MTNGAVNPEKSSKALKFAPTRNETFHLKDLMSSSSAMEVLHRAPRRAVTRNSSLAIKLKLDKLTEIPLSMHS